MKKISAIILSLCILISGLNFASNESYAATIKLNKSSIVLVKGEKYQLKVNNTKKKVTWSSSNKSIATVNSKGLVTAKSKGQSTITAKIGTKKYNCKVTVQSPYLSNTSVKLKVGSTKTIYLKGTSKTVTWSSSNKSVATVSKNGKITAKKAGTATITAKVGGKKYKCKVTVSKKQYSREYVKNYYAKKIDYETSMWVYDSSFDVKYNGEVCYLLAYYWNTATGMERITEIYIGSETLTNYGRIN